MYDVEKYQTSNNICDTEALEQSRRKIVFKNKAWKMLRFCENRTIIKKEPSKPKARRTERNEWDNLLVPQIRLMKKREF